MELAREMMGLFFTIILICVTWWVMQEADEPYWKALTKRQKRVRWAVLGGKALAWYVAACVVVTIFVAIGSLMASFLIRAVPT